MRRTYIYKCVVDDGGAPCVDEGLLSLAICKPYIRSTARKGDLIFAFGSNAEVPANRLVYIAEVDERLTKGAYFEHSEYCRRSDSIYERLNDGRLERRSGAKFHGDARARISDLGEEPDYPKASALISRDFRYFGGAGDDQWKALAPRLRSLVEGLGQGHRVNLTPQLSTELACLKDRIWIAHPTERVLGKPLHPADRKCVADPDHTVKVCRHRCYYIPTVKC